MCAVLVEIANKIPRGLKDNTICKPFRYYCHDFPCTYVIKFKFILDYN